MQTIFYLSCLGIITLCVIFMTVYASFVLQRLNRILSDIEEISDRMKQVSSFFSGVFTIFNSIRDARSFFSKKGEAKCQEKKG